jgi:hypothetical protein
MIFTKVDYRPWCIVDQCLESNIVFLETSYGAKRIELHKSGNTKLRVMKKL